MQVTLSDDVAASVTRLVEEGVYPDATAVVEAALDLLLGDSVEYDSELRRMILDGIASSDANTGRLLTPELVDEIKREGRRLLELRQRASH